MRIGTVNMKATPSTRTLSSVAGYRCGLTGMWLTQLHRMRNRNVHAKGRNVTSKASQGPMYAPNGDSGPIEDDNGGIAAKLVESELHIEANKSYLSYALSVIIGRALPDARDGLKPVHRRILYAMDELGLGPQKPHRKCARVVGEVLGKFHPHGDGAVYDSLVRMAQSFTLRHPLVDGHGNFGSQDDDPPAAMRYTECRLTKLTTNTLLKDLDLGTVNFIPNFDVSTEEPAVLPARIPNLLVNGSQGIAVGMATNIPPHNLGETVNALIAYIDNPDISVDELMTHMPGPDFPTGGLILSAKSSLRDIYKRGSGGITLRGKNHIETRESKRGDTHSIVITEIPYQACKSALIEQIAELVDKGKLIGISDIRDESDRDGMRIVIEVARRSEPQIVLNNLYQHTKLQQRFGYNMTALVHSQPKCLGLREFFEQFLEFRVEVIQNKSRFELDLKRERLHVVEGYLKTLAQLEEVIKDIRQAKSTSDAEASLCSKYNLTKKQAQAVLALPLRRLTSLEVDKAEEEQQKLLERIKSLEEMLEDHSKILEEVKMEALEVLDAHTSERKTTILASKESKDLELEDLIPNEPSIIVVSEQGYIKRVKVGAFQATRRNAKGKTAGNFRSDDEMALVLHVHAHDTLLCFSESGKVFAMRAHEVPEATRTSMGVALPRILKGWDDSNVTTVVPVSNFTKDKVLVLLSERGMVKKTLLSNFEYVTKSATSKIAINLAEGDKLGWVRMSSEGESLVVASKFGQVIRFPMSDDVLRPMGTRSRGVISMRMHEDDSIIGMDIVPEKKNNLAVLFVTSLGISKRVLLPSFKNQARGGKGVIGIKLKELDSLYAIRVVDTKGDDELLVATLSGKVNRYRIKDISTISRTAKGVYLMQLSGNDRVQSIATIQSLPEE